MVLALGFVSAVIVGGVVLMSLVATVEPGSPHGTPVASGGPTTGPPSTSGGSGAGSGGSASGAPTGASAATSSRLYRVGSVSGFGCTGRRIAPGSSASFETFLNSTTDCLDRTWSTAFDRAGMPYEEPQRVFWSTPGRSPCGDYPAPGVAAFYCSINNAMYIGVNGHAQRSAGNLPVIYNVAYARNLAHEYGHHVQEVSGILGYSREERMAAESIEERNAITRRSELQAQCFAGVFMSAVRPTFPVTNGQWNVALRDSFARGDDQRAPDERDHGSNAHYAGWLDRGFGRGRPGACNTWTAPASLVS
ncbi:MAG: neutral zinc metallopeptidase [Acidimicrobiia bacterium]